MEDVLVSVASFRNFNKNCNQNILHK